VSDYPFAAPGMFRSDQIRDGDPYELRDGHVVKCMTAGERHARANLEGGRVLATDPAVAGAAGVDAGFSFNERRNLRAPDISVGVGTTPGWMREAPPLAVEYADVGQDEPELQRKIREMLAAGTRVFWVVRLTGALRVEVYAAGEAMRVVEADGELTAPGILRNAVPVRALVDARAADAATLRNLLNAHGYESLDEVRALGEFAGQLKGQMMMLIGVLRARGWTLTPSLKARIEDCRDPAQLQRWVMQAVTAGSVEAALD
jgi:hypothetical protein